MYIKTLTLGYVSANCYIIKDEVSGEGAVIDPGDCNPNLLKAIIDSEIKNLKYIICTHSHFDHISGVGRLKEKYPEAAVVVGAEDAPALSDEVLSGAAAFKLPFFPCRADKTVIDGDVLEIGDLSLKVIHTPGHTLGGVVLYCSKEKVAFTGDTLFMGSVGRTDLYGGNHSVLMNSLKKIKKLPDETKLFCGHGESTTLQRELMYNFYLI